MLYYAKILDFPFRPYPYEVYLPTGYYQFEAWGASGLNSQPCAAQTTEESIFPKNGRGGYSKGILSLSEPKTFYVYVGQTGAKSGTFNGWFQL